MILKHLVRNRAETFVKEALKDYPVLMKAILRKPNWDKWVELCHLRCNQLDMAGYVSGGWALNDFIDKAASAYAHKVLDKLDLVKK